MKVYDNIIKSIRALERDEPPIKDISQMLYQHGCYYLLDKWDKENDYTKKLKSQFTLNQICISERFNNCREVFKAFKDKHILYAVIKGAVLSLTAYGNTYYRKSGDIDLLVDRGNVDEAKRILLDHGFIQGKVTDTGILPFSRQEQIFQAGLSHQIAPFIKKGSSPLCPFINVDVNTSLLWGESKIKEDMRFVLINTIDTEINGIPFKKLTPVMEFISLCLHHYKDMNSIYLLSQGSLKLSLFCDIYYYLKNNHLDIVLLKQTCERFSVCEYIYYCIYYTYQIFNELFLEHYLSTLQNQKAITMLEQFGLDGNEIRSWDICFYERLFSENFLPHFINMLTEKDLQKISDNHTHM